MLDWEDKNAAVFLKERGGKSGSAQNNQITGGEKRKRKRYLLKEKVLGPRAVRNTLLLLLLLKMKEKGKENSDILATRFGDNLVWNW